MYEESTIEEQFRGKDFKTFDQNLAYALAASDKGSCFEQEKLLALDRKET